MTPSLLPEEQYEPFDARKRARVEELAREEEDLLRSIAALKRRVPATTASTWASASRAAIASDEALLETARNRVLADLGGGGGAGTGSPQESIGGEGARAEEEEETVAGKTRKKRILLEDIGPLERQDVVEEDYKTAVETLGRLKKDMPATVAKMERARVAGGYVVTER